MTSKESFLNTATLAFKYWFGLGFLGTALFVFNRAHPLGSGIISLVLLGPGLFFLSVARIKLQGTGVRYLRLFRWHEVPYSEIVDCGEFWVYGYVRCRRFVFPWGRIYFVRSYSTEKLFGWDEEIIASVRSRAHISGRF